MQSNCAERQPQGIEPGYVTKKADGLGRSPSPSKLTTIMNDDLFNEASMVRGLGVDSMRVMGLFAKSHTNEQGRMKGKDRAAIRAAWDGTDPIPYARAANMLPEWFSGSVDVGMWEMLSAIKIASVPDKFQRLELVREWQSKTLSFDDVRARVDSLKPKRTKQVKHCANCGAEQP